MAPIKLMTIDQKIKDQLKALGVAVLYLFGSRALGLEGPLSDYDFAVLMTTTGHRRGDETYNALYDLLSPLCPRTRENDVIDIVFLNQAPLELKSHVMRLGRILYEADERARANFDERTMLEAADFRPLQDQIDKTILASL